MEYSHHARVYMFIDLYLCEYNYVHVAGAQRHLADGVGLVTTFCPSVPFLPARPGTPWRRKKRHWLVPILVPSEQQSRAHSPFQTHLPTIRSKFTLCGRKAKCWWRFQASQTLWGANEDTQPKTQRAELRPVVRNLGLPPGAAGRLWCCQADGVAVSWATSRLTFSPLKPGTP